MASSKEFGPMLVPTWNSLVEEDEDAQMSNKFGYCP